MISNNVMELNKFTKTNCTNLKKLEQYFPVDQPIKSICILPYSEYIKYVDGYFYVDEENNSLVGCILVSKEKSIAPLFIYNEYRDNKLAEQFVQVAVKELGAEWLYVEPNNKIAIKVYEKLGFEMIKLYKGKYYMCLKGSKTYREEKETIKGE